MPRTVDLRLRCEVMRSTRLGDRNVLKPSAGRYGKAQRHRVDCVYVYVYVCVCGYMYIEILYT